MARTPALRDAVDFGTGGDGQLMLFPDNVTADDLAVLNGAGGAQPRPSAPAPAPYVVDPVPVASGYDPGALDGSWSAISLVLQRQPLPRKLSLAAKARQAEKQQTTLFPLPGQDVAGEAPSLESLKPAPRKIQRR
jgi:hypothetical protein